MWRRVAPRSSGSATLFDNLRHSEERAVPQNRSMHVQERPGRAAAPCLCPPSSLAASCRVALVPATMLSFLFPTLRFPSFSNLLLITVVDSRWHRPPHSTSLLWVLPVLRRTFVGPITGSQLYVDYIQYITDDLVSGECYQARGNRT